eukprot:GSChrysophyteH2.ASY1.ANO1.1281.1 assembled CDS
MSRPLVSVYDTESATVSGTVTLPAVFTAPIRNDVVNQVHNLMSKNSRQAYGISLRAGMQTPAKSWGTGRAVSRIPRISTNQRRYAVSSALAASAVPALVMARGHTINNVPEMPLVLADTLNSVDTTKAARAILAACGAYDDVQKSADSRKVRAGSGKMRNRRYVQRRGPLVIYDVTEGIDRAFRNLPGVQLACVDNLNLLDLAPGGHMGRFCIWTKGAFEKLDSIFGTYDESATFKAGFNLPRAMMTNADLARIINSDEIQSLVKAPGAVSAVIPKKRNPLSNSDVKIALNPYHATVKAREEKRNALSKDARGKEIQKKRKADKATSKKFSAQKKAFHASAAAEGAVTF